MFKLKGADSSKKSFVLLDLYRSSFVLSFYDGKNLQFQEKKEIELFKVSNPKYEIYRNTLQELLESSFEKLKREANVNTQTFIVVLHGFFAKSNCYELYLSLDKSVSLLPDTLSSLIDKELNEQESFKNFLDEDGFSAEAVLVSKLSPKFYDLKNPTQYKAKEFSVVVHKSYVNKRVKNLIEEALRLFFDSANIYFVSASSALSLIKTHGGIAPSFVDLGREFTAFFRFYDTCKVWEYKSRVSLDSLIRELEKDLGLSYELSASQIELYLNGKCSSKDCVLIENRLREFEGKYKEAIEKFMRESSLSSSFYIIKNPNISPSLATWFLNTFSRATNISIKGIKDFNALSALMGKSLDFRGKKIFAL